jgi:hypothetical protein
VVLAKLVSINIYVSRWIVTIFTSARHCYLFWARRSTIYKIRHLTYLFPAVEDFSLLHSVQTDSGPTKPPIQLVQGVLSLGVKRYGRKADHSHLLPRSRKVELYLHSPICLHGVVLN